MIINNEIEHAEKMIKNGFQYKKYVFSELLMLSKYWIFHKELSVDDVKKNLHDFCFINLDGYDKDTSSRLINKVVQVANRSKLKVIKEIPITQSELNSIREMNDLSEEKVLFIMLVAYKINNYYAFSIAMDELFGMANLKQNSTNRLKIIHSLTLKKKINSNQKLKRWVTFSDKNSKASIVVTDFNQIVMHYLQWRGEPIINCELCRKLVKASSNRAKYCKECWKKKEKEIKRETWHKNKKKYRC